MANISAMNIAKINGFSWWPGHSQAYVSTNSPNSESSLYIATWVVFKIHENSFAGCLLWVLFPKSPNTCIFMKIIIGSNSSLQQPSHLNPEIRCPYTHPVADPRLRFGGRMGWGLKSPPPWPRTVSIYNSICFAYRHSIGTLTIGL